MNREKVLELAREAELARQVALEVPFVVDRLERFAALIEAEVRGDAEPVGWVVEHQFTAGKDTVLTDQDFLWSEGMDIELDLRNDSIDPNERWTPTIPLYLHPAPAVVRQLVDGLAGLIDFIEIDNLKIDQDALRIARASLATAKEAGL